MNTQANALRSQLLTPAVIPAKRQIYWALRREFWESRWIYLAPLAVSALFLLGFLIHLPMHGLSALDTAKRETVIFPYDMAAGLLMGTFLFVAMFYCVETLQRERRDRSILFWKSLPVSDVMTVHVLWAAPIYGWLLLVSAWARRAALLWAVLPPLAIGTLEKLLFNTSYFGAFVGRFFTGGTEGSYPPNTMPMDPGTHLTPARFLGTLGLWIGLAVTAAFLAAAVRLRRYRDPM